MIDGRYADLVIAATRALDLLIVNEESLDAEFGGARGFAKIELDGDAPEEIIQLRAALTALSQWHN